MFRNIFFWMKKSEGENKDSYVKFWNLQRSEKTTGYFISSNRSKNLNILDLPFSIFLFPFSFFHFPENPTLLPFSIFHLFYVFSENGKLKKKNWNGKIHQSFSNKLKYSSHQVQLTLHKIQITSNNSQPALILVNYFKFFLIGWRNFEIINQWNRLGMVIKFADALRLRFKVQRDESFQSLILYSSNPKSLKLQYPLLLSSESHVIKYEIEMRRCLYPINNDET